MFSKSKAQSTAEYAILLGLVIAAAAAMQIYVKRGVQARIHAASRVLVTQTSNLDTGAGQTVATGYQYEPYYLNSQMTVNRQTNAYSVMDRPGNISANALESTIREEGGYQRYEFDSATDNEL